MILALLLALAPQHFSGTLEQRTVLFAPFAPPIVLPGIVSGSTDHTDTIALEAGHSSVSLTISHNVDAALSWDSFSTKGWQEHSFTRAAWALRKPDGSTVGGARSLAEFPLMFAAGAWLGSTLLHLPTSGTFVLSPVPAFVTVTTTARTQAHVNVFGRGWAMLTFSTTYSFAAVPTYSP